MRTFRRLTLLPLLDLHPSSFLLGLKHVGAKRFSSSRRDEESRTSTGGKPLIIGLTQAEWS